MKNIILRKPCLLIAFGFIAFVGCSTYTEHNSMKSNNSYGSQKIDPKIKNYVKMEKKVLDLLSTEKYVQLDSFIKGYTKEEINIFYKQKGNDILKWALRFSKDDCPLKFLIENIPLELNIEILKEKNYAIICSFINDANLLAEQRWFKKADRKNFSDKLAILFSLPEESGVKNAIENFVYQDNTLDSVKLVFVAAKESFDLAVL